MKQMTPAERLSDLERQVIAQHLASEPGTDELASIAVLRALVETGEFFEPRQWDAWDQREARALWIELKLGLDARWTDPPPDLFKSRAAYERFTAFPLQKQ